LHGVQASMVGCREAVFTTRLASINIQTSGNRADAKQQNRCQAIHMPWGGEQLSLTAFSLRRRRLHDAAFPIPYN
jgi:hypothetical protein